MSGTHTLAVLVQRCYRKTTPTAKFPPRQSALFILRYQPRRLFPAAPMSHFVLCRFSHEPTTSQENARQKNGLARTRTVEDTETTFEELSGQFGEDASNLVREVTDDKSLDKALRKQLQIEHAAKSSDKAKQIKLADKICNIRDIMSSPPAEWTLERRTEYLDWSSKVVSGCRGVNEKLEQVFDHAIEQARESLR